MSCASSGPPSTTASAESGNQAFDELARAFLEDLYQRQPTWATSLGIHKYDDRLDDYSRNGVDRGIASARSFRARVAAVDAASLSLDRQLDREQLLHAIDSQLLTLEVVRPWATDPDTYSSGLTRTAYIMIKRNFAPPEERLRQLIAREKAMPAALAEARTNLQNPPRVYTEIAIEQVDGNREFFETAVASAFPTVTDKALLAEFTQANGAVIAALVEYKKWLEHDLLPRSNGSFALRRRHIPQEACRRRDDRVASRRAAANRRARFAAEPGGICGNGPEDRFGPRAARRAENPRGRSSGARETPLDDTGRAGFAGPLHDRKADCHDSEGGAGPGRGDAALPAGDHFGVDRNSRSVRTGCDRDVLQHDAPGSEGDGRGEERVHGAVVLPDDYQRVGA